MGESEAELDEQAPGTFIFRMVPGEQRRSSELGEPEVDYGPCRFFRQPVMPKFRTNMYAEFKDSRRPGVGPQPGASYIAAIFQQKNRPVLNAVGFTGFDFLA